MTVSSSTNKVSYNGDGSTTVFAYSFKVFDQDDLTVILRASDGTETTQTLTTNYSVSGVGDAGGGNVTMVTAPASGQILTIVREQPLTQGLDLVPNDPFPAQSLEESLDKLTFIDQRLSENIDRALSFSVGDIVDSATLPVKEDRIGRVLGFNATTGNPEAGPEIADVSTLSAITADISTLADIEDGTDATDAIQTVAGISGNVTTVAGISSDVTTVAGITGNIASVVADEADIGVVAGISGDVSTVSAISTDVTTVAADGTDIGVVAGISSDVTTVSGISTDVTTVSSISSDVTTVVGNAASITTVAGNSSNVTIVADNIADVTTVASNISSITTKVSKSGDTMTGNLLFDDTSKVLLGTRSNLQIYHSATAITASNITLYFTNGSTSGTMEITDTDHTISVSDTVRVDSPEILNSTPVTVAGVVLSSLQQDLTVSATTATTFTVPVTYASDPGTTGTLGQAGTYYYYTGSATSYISEQGAGSLHVLGSEINVYNADETSQLAQFSTAATKLFHNNSEKLTTTATGISLPEDLTVQGNLTVQGTTITVDSATAQTIDLGDGDRMRFGDSNDAYIEWNGTYFDARSTGRFDLLSSGNDLRLSTGTNVGLIVNHTGGTPAVQLYNSGVQRLATTSTGIDVTGTVTADGLTVEKAGGSAALFKGYTSVTSVDSANNGEILLGNNSSYQGRISYEGNGGVLYIENSYSNNAADILFRARSSGTAQNKLLIEGTGDISFYEDTGTTAKFFWDASAEVLGIGTATPNVFSNTGLHIHDSTTSRLHMTNGTTGSAYTDGWEMQAFSDDFYILGREAAGDIIMYPANSEAMRITSSGNVGIGTSSPDNKLTIGDSSSIVVGKQWGLDFQDTAKGEPQAFIYAEGQYTANFNTDLIFGTIGTSGSATERMRIDSSGNVGIGTSSPAVLSHVAAGYTAPTGGLDAGIRSLVSSTGYTGLGILSASNASAYVHFGDPDDSDVGGIIYGHSSNHMQFNVNASERMRIDSSGNLLLGTSAHAGYGPLQVGSTSTASTIIQMLAATNGYNTIHFGDATSGTGRYAGYVQYNHTDDKLFLGAGTATRMTLDGSGNATLTNSVGVNSATGYPVLQNAQASNTFPSYTFYGDDNTGMFRAAADTLAFATGGSERMRIDSSGNLLVGTTTAPNGTSAYGSAFVGETNSRKVLYLATSSTAQLSVARFYNPNGQVGEIKTDGSSTLYVTSSDYRLKEDWQPMTGASDRVLALKPVNFAWKVNGSRVDGFLAHEAQAVVPEAVIGAKDAMRDEEYEVTPAVLDENGSVITEAVMGTRSVPDYQGIDQSKLVPLLTAALQEALNKITDLETRITALEAN